MATHRPRLVALVLTGASLAGCGINNIPTYDEAADAAWAAMQGEYRRRADLATDLVATFEEPVDPIGPAEPEREALAALVEARARVAGTEVTPGTLNDPVAFERFRRNQDAFGAALRRLAASVEARADRDPERASDPRLVALRDRLEGVENRLAFARGNYVEAVRRYNTELRTIPGRWWAAFMYPHMAPRQNFATPGTATGTAPGAGPA